MEQKPLMLALRHTQKEWLHYLKKLALEAGVPSSYRPIIMYLSRHPGASQKDLAEDAQITYAAISKTIKDMQRAEYLTKKIDAQDQRYARLFLTEKGELASNRIREKIHAADRMITSVITPEKEREIVSVLNLLGETIRKEL